jgi:hypothetical protein
MARGTKKKKEPRVIPGTSDYVVRENAARKQLGVAGLAARNKQVPAAARATARGLLREITGIDVSRKGVKVDPMGLAMALPLGKVVKAAKVLRAAGKIGQATALESRLKSNSLGANISKSVDFYKRGYYNSFNKKSLEEGVPAFEFPGSLPSNVGVRGKLASAIEYRNKSESVFPRVTKKVK